MNPCNKNVILHVGMPKTASSFLQLEIFPHLQNVCHTGNGDRNVKKTPFRIFYDYKRNIGLTKDNDHALFSDDGIVNRFKKNVVRFINSKPEDTFLFSCEGLLGLGLYAFCNYEKRAATYKHVFPDAKVIIVIRKQDDWMESFYNQVFVKEDRLNRYVGMNDFIGCRDDQFHEEGEFLNIHNLNILKIIQHYHSLFSKENVLTLPYELFKAEPRLFLEKIYEFAGIEPYYPDDFSRQINIRRTEGSDSREALAPKKAKLLSRITSRIAPGITGKKDKAKPVNEKYDYADQTLSARQKERIMSIHKKSNAALSERIGLDLSEYGYH